MVKFSLLAIILSLCVSLESDAQKQVRTAQISGTVVDSVTLIPLTGATVFIEKLQKGTSTDHSGKFSIAGIPPGTYHFTISFLGYKTLKIKQEIGGTHAANLIFKLKRNSFVLGEVVVRNKSEARKIREQAFPVSVISMKSLQGTVSDVQSILARTAGVTIRASGGAGSSSRISVRGLEGKRIGFFIDEIPLGDQSDFIDLNDIPIDMIDRIEIFKGIVPAKFGGSSMGGAVNIVIKEYPDRYADFSYQRESFNVNKVQTVYKRNLKDKGLVFGIGGGYTHADNNYTMESPFVKGLKIKRHHDQFRKLITGGSLKARKWWFDKIEFEPVFMHTRKQIQGIETDIRKAETTSSLFALNNKLEKEDFITEGLDYIGL